MEVLLHDRHERCSKQPSQDYNDIHEVITYPLYHHFAITFSRAYVPAITTVAVIVNRVVKTHLTLITGIPVTLLGRIFMGFLYVC